MRRFIASLPGRLLAQVVIVALLMPFVTLASIRTAVAQVTVLPTWAVVEFKNRMAAKTEYGKTAAEAISGELSKTGQYDVAPQATVQRAIEDLGIASPPDGDVNLLRVANQVRASTVVSGEIVEYKILSSAAGKQAVVALQLVVTDVASGLAFNGATVEGRSTVRPGDVADETLINDAIVQGANQGIAKIQAQQLPIGTVLNTLEREALINKGSRSGFKVGQKVIVIRGREQVASATVSDVEPDSSTVKVDRLYKGIAPGDRVRAIFTVPSFMASGALSKEGHIRTTKSRSGNNAGLITALIVLGVVAALVAGPGSSGTSVTERVTAEAMLYPDVSGVPSVRVSWKANGFAGGRSSRYAWQVWRNDIFDSPVLVVSGDQTKAYDTEELRSFSYLDLNQIGGTTCISPDPTNGDGEDVLGVTVGRPYTYSVELVYALSSIDLPDGGTTGGSTTGSTTGGTTGTTGTTTGGTTGTTTGGTTGTTTGGSFCYFVSSRQSAKGLATPLGASTQVSPAANASVSAAIPFTFSSVITGSYNLSVEYVVQLSTDPSFPRGDRTQTLTSSKVISTSRSTISTPSIDTASSSIKSAIRTASTVYWRVGARNTADKPGPVADSATGERYIFSQWRTFTRPSTPPDPPL